MNLGWLDRESEWLGPRRMDTPPPVPPVVREALERVVYWIPVRCPGCGGTKCPVTSNRGTHRNHKCRDCARTFKSFERK
jgi:hypothetical protein